MVWVVILAWGVLAFAGWGDRSHLNGILNIYKNGMNFTPFS